jgi:hypothetical protein
MDIARKYQYEFFHELINCYICIRADFCLEQPNPIMHMGWFFHNLIENLQIFHMGQLLRLQILHANKEEIGMTYT